MQTTLHLDLNARNYLEESPKNPQSVGFRKSYSTIVNEALVLYAARDGQELHIEPAKRRGRRASRPRRQDERKGEAGWRKPEVEAAEKREII